VIINAPISLGELVDKLTILLIKLDKINDAAKRVNIQAEFNLLDTELRRVGKSLDVNNGAELLELTGKLKEINEFIWRVEDDIRDHERRQDFGNSFIQLARNVYIFNDRRASHKRAINDLFGSTIKEEKSYKEY
jgi:hypothetical protein